MMQPFPLLVEEVLEDGGARDGLDDFVDDAAGGDVGVAEAEGERYGGAVIGLVGGVGRVAGVDAPWAEAEA